MSTDRKALRTTTALGKWSRVRRIATIVICFALPAFGLYQGIHVLTFNPDDCFSKRIPPDAIAQFNHLKSYYDHVDLGTVDRWDTRNDMDLMMTEWPVFCNSFFTFALRDMAEADPSFKPRAVEYMRLAIEETMRRRSYGYIVGRYGNPFDEKNKLHDNALYLGHLNMMLGCYRKLSGDGRFDAVHHRITKALFDGVMAIPTCNIESYPNECWPCDNALVMDSLKYHDDVFGSHYSVACGRWVAFYRKHLDPKTGIMPAFISTASGEAEQPPRAVCLGYSLPFIADFDPKFAREQWLRAKRCMFVSRFGFGATREYPRGIDTAGDIDTGPLVFGIGPASSAFMLAAAKSVGDRQAFDEIMRTGEVIGCPLALGGGKRYLLSARVGDSVALWAKTRPPSFAAPTPKLDRTGSTVAGLLIIALTAALTAGLLSELRKTLQSGQTLCPAAKRQIDRASQKINVAGLFAAATITLAAAWGLIPVLYALFVGMLVVLAVEVADGRAASTIARSEMVEFSHIWAQ